MSEPGSRVRAAQAEPLRRSWGPTLRWRFNRLLCMSPAELPYRAARLIAAHVESIAPRRRSIPSPDRGPWATRWVHVPEGIDAALYVAAADRIVAGELEVFGVSCANRSEERRVGKERRCRGSPYHEKITVKN